MPDLIYYTWRRFWDFFFQCNRYFKTVGEDRYISLCLGDVLIFRARRMAAASAVKIEASFSNLCRFSMCKNGIRYDTPVLPSGLLDASVYIRIESQYSSTLLLASLFIVSSVSVSLFIIPARVLSTLSSFCFQNGVSEWNPCIHWKFSLILIWD